jgi:arsenate reductase (glutaredoxin)
MIKIYHNPRCRKSREGLKFLEEKKIDFEIVDYLKSGISISDIKDILLKLNLKPKDLIRTNEILYKKELKNLNLKDEEWIKVISENPNLLCRPIVLAKHKGVIANPPENINKLV